MQHPREEDDDEGLEEEGDEGDGDGEQEHVDVGEQGNRKHDFQIDFLLDS